MVLIISFVSELVSRVFVSGDSRNSGDQNTTTMVGSLPDRRIPSAVSRSVACAFGLLLLGAICIYVYYRFDCGCFCSFERMERACASF